MSVRGKGGCRGIGRIISGCCKARCSGDSARGKRIIKDTVTIEKAEACSGDRNSRRLFFYLHDRISVEDAQITTLELSEERTAEARTNVKRLGKETQIQVICGDAAETLKELPDDAYEFAFVDAAKAQYIYYLPDVLRVLKPGGVIVSDNILQEGEVLESHFLVEKRNRTIHDRMREYLYVLTHDDRLETAILPVGDGMAISVLRELCKESEL